jgi:hypothetical protein
VSGGAPSMAAACTVAGLCAAGPVCCWASTAGLHPGGTGRAPGLSRALPPPALPPR